jgi:hypothetical protein
MDITNDLKTRSNNIKRKISKNDFVLNVGLKEALIRFGFTFFIPIFMLVVDKHLIIYTIPVIAYLFITALTHFCVIKYLWHRYVKHELKTVSPPYGEDINYPDESV